MKNLESFINNYFTFHYGIGFAIGLLIFCEYMILTTRKKKSQGQSVSKKEILCGLALSIYMVFLCKRQIASTFRTFFWFEIIV